MEHNEMCTEMVNFIKSNLVAANIEVTSEKPLSEMGLDSFSIIEVVLFIERKFGIALPDEALTQENIKSVSSLATCAQSMS